jgi:GxxExxY protein
LTYAVIGAAMEVHRELGCGFMEAIYQRAMAIELAGRHIPFEPEHQIPISYKGQALGLPHRANFFCQNSLVVELKALPEITGREIAQVLHYLKASGTKKALLLNFGRPSLEYRRFIRSQEFIPNTL